MELMKLSLLIFTTFLTPSSNIDQACGCLGKYSDEIRQIKYERKQSKAVFSGQVVSVVEKGSYHVEVKFRVVESWKGSIQNNISVTTEKDSPGSCGYAFQIGETYLIYALKSEKGRLRTSICTRTRRITEAETDKSVLGKRKVLR